jgi:hypothetical protein
MVKALMNQVKVDLKSRCYTSSTVKSIQEKVFNFSVLRLGIVLYKYLKTMQRKFIFNL